MSCLSGRGCLLVEARFSAWDRPRYRRGRPRIDDCRIASDDCRSWVASGRRCVGRRLLEPRRTRRARRLICYFLAALLELSNWFAGQVRDENSFDSEACADLKRRSLAVLNSWGQRFHSVRRSLWGLKRRSLAVLNSWGQQFHSFWRRVWGLKRRWLAVLNSWGQRFYSQESSVADLRSVISMARNSPRALLRVSWYSFSGTLSATMPAPAWTYAVSPWMTMVRSAMQVSILPP